MKRPLPQLLLVTTFALAHPPVAFAFAQPTSRNQLCSGNSRISSSGQCFASSPSSPPWTSLDATTASAASVAAATIIRGGASVAAASSTATGTPIGAGSLWLVRSLFLRCLAFVYGVAFLVALHQNKALIGDRGITPARNVLDAAYDRGKLKRRRREDWLHQRQNYTSLGDKDEMNTFWYRLRNMKTYRKVEDKIESSNVFCNMREVLWDRCDRMDRPLLTLLYLAKDRSNIDPWLDGIAKAGIAMAAFVFFTGAANVPILFGLWLCQRSIMSVGGTWYGFGWEPQLAELGFHAMFMVPLLSLNPIPTSTPVPLLVVWTIRWYLFRIMIGAGLIKIKSGDRKWKDLTAMDGFYETQPVPNPFSKYFHSSPKWFHKFEVLTNHFVELVAPWLIIIPGLPRAWRIGGGLIQIVFQGVLISSGNLSFLNWLTAVPSICCLDDAFLLRLYYPFMTGTEATAAYSQAVSPAVGQAVPVARKIISVVFTALIAKLSMPVVRNLLARRQIMNGSFDRYRLVNTYGAFGTVSDVREELIIESATNLAGPWKEYTFKVKPGPLTRRPPWISPYHFRLDWLMWIACVCGGIERSPWLLNLLKKLLEQDEGVMGLLESDPWASNDETTELKVQSANSEEDSTSRDPRDFADNDGTVKSTPSKVPKYIRIERYRYQFNFDKTVVDGNGRALYWKRERVGRYFPRQGVVTKDILNDIIAG